MYNYNENPGSENAYVVYYQKGFFGNASTGPVDGGATTVTRGKRKGVTYLIKVL